MTDDRPGGVAANGERYAAVCPTCNWRDRDPDRIGDECGVWGCEGTMVEFEGVATDG